jgi:hypothetical protein
VAGGVAVSDASCRAFDARLGRFPGSRLAPPPSVADEGNAAGGFCVSYASCRAFDARFSGSRLAPALSFDDDVPGAAGPAAVVSESCMTTIFSVVSDPITMPIAEQASISISVVNHTRRDPGNDPDVIGLHVNCSSDRAGTSFLFPQQRGRTLS